LSSICTAMQRVNQKGLTPVRAVSEATYICHTHSMVYNKPKGDDHISSHAINRDWHLTFVQPRCWNRKHTPFQTRQTQLASLT
jgi:hypothetical protein